MKKIYLMAIATLFAVGLTSCEDFLDSKNYTQANSSNYPASADDLNKELAALYGVMNQFSTGPLETPWFVGYIMSDDANGAGGTGDVESHAVGHLMANKEDMYDNAWHNTYVGIARANAIIYAVDAFDWTGQEATRNQLLGEAYFMRGLFYLWGVQFWGDIPAYWASAAPDPCPQQSAEDVIMPHILADFTSAANLMTHGMTTRGDGHATKGAAEGYLARAYMFYEGFYKKAGELASASLADVTFDFEQEAAGSSLSKAQVVAFLEDAINNGGYKLVEDFRLLWQYTNEYTIQDYKFVADLKAAGKQWAGNGNEEEMFQVQYMNSGSWNGTIGMGFVNQIELYCALRCDDDGAGTANGSDRVGARVLSMLTSGTSGLILTHVRRLLSSMLRLSAISSCLLPHALRMLVTTTRSGWPLLAASLPGVITMMLTSGGVFTVRNIHLLPIIMVTLCRVTTSLTSCCSVWPT
jgi:hypothetical protein